MYYIGQNLVKQIFKGENEIKYIYTGDHLIYPNRYTIGFHVTGPGIYDLSLFNADTQEMVSALYSVSNTNAVCVILYGTKYYFVISDPASRYQEHKSGIFNLTEDYIHYVTMELKKITLTFTVDPEDAQVILTTTPLFYTLNITAVDKNGNEIPDATVTFQ
ncbi:MAG: hypothetical protein LUF04_08565 [Bacteroides sp.]|nr:hypothetical protein [Bacteroides sp.]